MKKFIEWKRAAGGETIFLPLYRRRSCTAGGFLAENYVASNFGARRGERPPRPPTAGSATGAAVWIHTRIK